MCTINGVTFLASPCSFKILAMNWKLKSKKFRTSQFTSVMKIVYLIKYFF